MRAIVAVIDKRGERSASRRVVEMLEVFRCGGAEAFGVGTSKDLDVKSSLENLQCSEARAAVGQAFFKVMPWDEPQPTFTDGAALVFNGRVYNPPEPIDFRKEFEGAKLEDGAKSIIGKFEGGFAFAIANSDNIVLGRDSIGLYPLYYSENGDLFAAASERKALWRLGFDEVKSFPPGCMAVVDSRGIKMEGVKPLGDVCLTLMSMEEAAEKLKNLIECSVRERVWKLNKVAVAFSGGLDSSIIAALAQQFDVEVHLIHVTMNKHSEREQAEGLIGTRMNLRLYGEEDVENALPKVLWSVEEPDPIKVAIGIPIFWAAEEAARLGFRVMMAGQGADELFGGYMRYLSTYISYGKEKAQRSMAADIMNMHRDNFERDVKVCLLHNVELRLPYAARNIVDFAMELPIEMKIDPAGNGLRKIILRRAAEKAGLSVQIVNRPKRAIQYSTGVDKALKKLAKKEGLTLSGFIQKVFQTLKSQFINEGDVKVGV
ncbi:MAG: asparagine synthetase B [Candidatus Bathyarchaeota archaeon]|nr:asparagine synthetase B [Candidatus Bathyarchaeota archaeon]